MLDKYIEKIMKETGCSKEYAQVLFREAVISKERKTSSKHKLWESSIYSGIVEEVKAKYKAFKEGIDLSKFILTEKSATEFVEEIASSDSFGINTAMNRSKNLNEDEDEEKEEPEEKESEEAEENESEEKESEEETEEKEKVTPQATTAPKNELAGESAVPSANSSLDPAIVEPGKSSGSSEILSAEDTANKIDAMTISGDVITPNAGNTEQKLQEKKDEFDVTKDGHGAEEEDFLDYEDDDFYKD